MDLLLLTWLLRLVLPLQMDSPVVSLGNRKTASPINKEDVVNEPIRRHLTWLLLPLDRVVTVKLRYVGT